MFSPLSTSVFSIFPANFRICLFVLAVTVTAPFATAISGDIDGDSVVSTTDSALLVDYLVSRRDLTTDSLVRADANLDTAIDAADLVGIASRLGADETAIDLPGSVSLTLVRITSGSFAMGAALGERGRSNDECPTRTVTFEYDFYLGQTEVTQKQWYALMGRWPRYAPSPTYGAGDDYPLHNVSWRDAQSFVTTLNSYVTTTSQGSMTFRLPSEAEWEYACRAGTTTRFYFGDSLGCNDGDEDCAAGVLPGNRTDYMWYRANNGSMGEPDYGTKEVAGKRPNRFGLYDMSGNVTEWCQDCYHESYEEAPTDGSAYETTGSYRVTRGGAWNTYANDGRSARRYGRVYTIRDANLGFRLAAQP